MRRICVFGLVAAQIAFIMGICLGSNIQPEWNHPSNYHKVGLFNTISCCFEMDSQ